MIVFKVRECMDEAGKSRIRVVGSFPTFREARDFAVPGHPEEWVYLDDGDCWFHGGGNCPGQSFTIHVVEERAEYAEHGKPATPVALLSDGDIAYRMDIWWRRIGPGGRDAGNLIKLPKDAVLMVPSGDPVPRQVAATPNFEECEEFTILD
ncbi:hypothetical protein [Nocardia brasiliensis]|uniref:hypothetical protein n=1 Tax=Nocardia brasiliensis TaxID=37326 RepID=UPI002455D27B|nr:hypothetical protein [Nocardia brasiliensis]